MRPCLRNKTIKGTGGEMGLQPRGEAGLLGMMKMFFVLIVVMVSRAYKFVRLYQNNVNYSLIKLIFKETVKKPEQF